MRTRALALRAVARTLTHSMPGGRAVLIDEDGEIGKDPCT